MARGDGRSRPPRRARRRQPGKITWRSFEQPGPSERDSAGIRTSRPFGSSALPQPTIQAERLWGAETTAADVRRRRLSDLVLGCNIYGALEDDRVAAMDACRAIAAWFPQTAPHYAELIGVPKDRVDAIRRAYAGGHFDEARDAVTLVTDEMVAAFALTGDTGVWIERLEAIQSMGVNLFVIYPMVSDKLGTIRRIAREILPRFRG